MERRQVIGLSVGPLIALGGAALVTANAFATYAEPLRYVAVACFAGSVGVWLCLLLTASGADPKTPYIGEHEAGIWLYEHARPRLKKALSEFVPEPFRTTGQAGTAYIRSGAEKAGCPLFARRGEGFALEPVTVEELGEAQFINKMIGAEPIWRDVSIRRRDLRRILNYYPRD
jgi:hypothetical protein